MYCLRWHSGIYVDKWHMPSFRPHNQSSYNSCSAVRLIWSISSVSNILIYLATQSLQWYELVFVRTHHSQPDQFYTIHFIFAGFSSTNINKIRNGRVIVPGVVCTYPELLFTLSSRGSVTMSKSATFKRLYTEERRSVQNWLVGSG